MSGADLSSVGVLFALPDEAKPFRRFQRECGHVAVAVSGMGGARASASASVVLSMPTVRRLLICGFAGGLSPDCSPGDLILADTVSHNAQVFRPDSALLEAAGSVSVSGITVRRGTLVTGDRVLTTTEEKRELAAQTNALAVDMETAHAARAAQENGVPWLAVRAITDGASDELPLDFNAFAGPDGLPDRGRIVRATLARPHKIPALLRLGKRSSFAAANLAAFLEALLLTLPEKGNGQN